MDEPKKEEKYNITIKPDDSGKIFPQWATDLSLTDPHNAPDEVIIETDSPLEDLLDKTAGVGCVLSIFFALAAWAFLKSGWASGVGFAGGLAVLAGIFGLAVLVLRLLFNVFYFLETKKREIYYRLSILGFNIKTQRMYSFDDVRSVSLERGQTDDTFHYSLVFQMKNGAPLKFVQNVDAKFLDKMTECGQISAAIMGAGFVMPEAPPPAPETQQEKPPDGNS